MEMDIVEYIAGLDVPLDLPARSSCEPVPERLVRLVEEVAFPAAEHAEVTGGEKPPEAEAAARTAARIARYAALGAAAVRPDDLNDLEGALRRLNAVDPRNGITDVLRGLRARLESLLEEHKVLEKGLEAKISAILQEALETGRRERETQQGL